MTTAPFSSASAPVAAGLAGVAASDGASAAAARASVDFALLADVLALQGLPIAGRLFLPEHFQYLPPGHLMCGASPKVNAQNGSGWTAVHVHKGTADTLQRSFETLVQSLEKGRSPAWPWIDFDHLNCASAGRVLGFFWSDAPGWDGGVRCRAEWSLAGALAVLGRTYTRFSPSVQMDLEVPNEVVGTYPCVGGLTNSPGFFTIAPLLPEPPRMVGQEHCAQSADALRASAQSFERMVASLALRAGLPRGEAIRAAKMCDRARYVDWLRWIASDEAPLPPVNAED